MTMSRRLSFVVAVMLLIGPHAAVAGPSSPLETYERLTAVEPRCTAPATNSEILVCGRRAADRWRVPYIGYEAGDPRGESVMQERASVLLEALKGDRKAAQALALRML